MHDSKVGWCLSAGQSLQKGEKIGYYTGEIRTRIAPNEDSTYLFTVSSTAKTPEFQIDALKTGNVTRFIEHSCRPNLEAEPIEVTDGFPVIAIKTAKYIEKGV